MKKNNDEDWRFHNIKKRDRSFNFVFAWDGWELCFHAKQIQNIFYMNL